MGQVKANKFYSPGFSSTYEIKGKGWYHDKYFKNFEREYGGIREHIDSGYLAYMKPIANDKINDALNYVNTVMAYSIYDKVLPYIPYDTGNLQSSLKIIGSKKQKRISLEMTGPYVRYMYYGEIYGPNYPIIKGGKITGFYSPSHKYPTGRPINYNTTHSAKAGRYWFNRMKADEKDNILYEAKRAFYIEGVRCK